MSVQQDQPPYVTKSARAQYVAPAMSEFGHVRDLTSAASVAGKVGKGQETSNSWQTRP